MSNKIKINKKYSLNVTLFVSIPNSGFIMHRLRLLFGSFTTIMIQEHTKENIRFWTYSDFKYWCNYLGYSLKGVYVSSTTKIFGIDLGKLFPALFGKQIIYEIKRK